MQAQNIRDTHASVCVVQGNAGISGNYNWQFPISHRLRNAYSVSNSRSLLELAYIVSLHNRQVYEAESNPVKINPPNFDVIEAFDVMIVGNLAWGMYSKSLDIAVVVFTGTYNTELVAVDIAYLQKTPTSLSNTTPGICLHGGFLTAYEQVQAQILSFLNKYVKPTTQVVFTGWSLGGALSSICVFDMFQRKLETGVQITNPIHYSFASPRVFNVIGANYYDSLEMHSYRILNGCDLVPTVPLAIMASSLTNFEYFQHVRKAAYFECNMESAYDNHITAYFRKYNLNL